MKKKIILILSAIIASISMSAQVVNIEITDAVDSCAQIEAIDTLKGDYFTSEEDFSAIEEDMPMPLDLFLSAPSKTIRLINEYSRLLLIYDDEQEALDMTDGDSCRVVANDSVNFEVEFNSGFRYQVVLLNDELVMLITTHVLPVQDSDIEFFDVNWESRSIDKYFKTPKLNDWLTKEGKKNRKKVEETVPFLIVKYHYDANSGILTLTNNLKEYFIAETWTGLAPYFKTEIKYKWTGKKFKAVL